MSELKQNIFKRIFHKTRRYLAKRYFKIFEPYCIAITGSQGKTNTSNILHQLFENSVITDTNLDTLYNVPITTFKIRNHKQIAIYELGVDKLNEMSLHLEIVKPNISIITGISNVHSDKEHLGSLDNIIKEKRKIIEVLNSNDYAILNYDDINVRNMYKHTKAKVIFYGSNRKNCDIYFNNKYSIDLKGTKFSIYDKDNNEIKINTKLIGFHHISNIMAAYATYNIIKPNNTQSFVNIINTIKPLSGRMSLEKGPLNTMILNDSLRSNIYSAVLGLKSLNEIKGDIENKIAIIGEMGEIGDKEIDKHKELGYEIANFSNIKYIIGIGPLLQYTKDSAIKNGIIPSKFFWAKDITVASTILQMIVKKNDLIYIKGSRLKHMERLLMIINGDNVGCNVISCPYYNHCKDCKYLERGL